MRSLELTDDAPATPAPPGTRRRSRPDLLTTVGILAFVFFVLATVGSPLWGGTVLAATDELATRSPYYESGLAGTQVQNTYMDDTYDAVIPDTLLFTEQLRDGHLADWNPYVLGGVPLSVTPTLALLNPLTLPYYVLPGNLAPGYVKLLETVFCGAMTFLFLRRLRLGRPAAVVGGLVFASSAFMVVWTNWPHTRTAAFIPAVFWAVERLVQTRRVRDAALVTLAVGGMIAGGFPAVTAFTLFTVAPYALVRALAEHPGQWRRVLGVLAGAGAAVAGAVALLAVQLLPFARNMSGALVAGREQLPGEHLAPASLITALSPFALGTVKPSSPPTWYLPVNMVESMAYLGAAGLVLIVVAVSAPWVARTVLPRGVWSFLVATLGVWMMILYTGPGVSFAHHFPVFSSNFVGRARSVVWLLLAALAAYGLEVLLRRSALNRKQILYAAAVWLAAAGAAAFVLREARRAAYHTAGTAAVKQQRVDQLNHEVLIGAVYLAVVLALVAVVWWSGNRTQVRTVAAAALPVLAAIQAVGFTVPYLPRVDKDTFFPVTATQAYLQEHLGQDRFASTYRAMWVGVDSKLELRSLNGHSFPNKRFAELIKALPGDQLKSPTYLSLPASYALATSPVMDRLSVRYFITSPRDPVFGTRHASPGPAFVARGPLRAVSVTPAAPLPVLPVDAAVRVVLRDQSGRQVASSQRLVAGMSAGKPFDIPIVAPQVRAGDRLTAEMTTTGISGTLRFAEYATVVDPGDGLRLVQASPAVVYERLTALPRIRWASQASVVGEQTDRLAAGDVPRDEVLLDEAGAPADGRPAEVDVVADGSDQIEAAVTAQGAGYLVVADAIQSQWKATVDGKAVPLVPADHGLVAVPVPAGEHTVRLHYAAPAGNIGGWISLIMIFALVAVLVAGRVRDRRRNQVVSTA